MMPHPNNFKEIFKRPLMDGYYATHIRLSGGAYGDHNY